MKKKGKLGWIPGIVLTEIEDIKREDGLRCGDSEAFRELTRYARVGREAKRMATFNWGSKMKLPKIPKVKGKKTRRRIF